MINQAPMPKIVQTNGQAADSIEKSLWVLRNKFNFHTTTRLKETSFQNLQYTMDFFLIVKFPVLIAVRGKLACYHHVVVVWKGMVFDYESKYT